MEYDVYCAICGFEIGPWSPAALEQRDRYVNGEMSEKEAEENAPVGYDPRLVDPDDCDWLLDIYCLGYNKHATGERKTFVIGPGVYVDLVVKPKRVMMTTLTVDRVNS
ncbi:hypothetical protein CNMCM8980_001135 [Aspergillus fumigatiaffinis]|uniref:Uncharacterized protein n=1 Tax=Aspergillus fumigatiaffinis TaxID=340414 RepID=A0A8H4H265_9EURO|nr:hypothetical protein CNMCM5878_004313 [Aspergillus fumigatiaffinis]KAF4224372.1 hypothetical protein CNMCM6457_009497 [Aspergillus fumigatiaffinis]KAF4233051.1 hypothetical protein CNMCM6805_009536 [Aspergillus fumigatiaffinis]KAF4240766.1 hypothetical protein CNMCM8980_001135 [Aspergillus fumigatiaffinis]